MYTADGYPRFLVFALPGGHSLITASGPARCKPLLILVLADEDGDIRKIVGSDAAVPAPGGVSCAESGRFPCQLMAAVCPHNLSASQPRWRAGECWHESPEVQDPLERRDRVATERLPDEQSSRDREATVRPPGSEARHEGAWPYRHRQDG